MLRRIWFGLAVGVAFAAYAAAGAAAPGGPGAPQICQTLAAKHASAFAAKFGSESACEQVVGGILDTARSTCKSQGLTPHTDAFKSCVNQQVQAGIKAVHGQAGGGSGRSGGGSGKDQQAKVAAIAKTICKVEKTKIGDTLFKQKYGGAGNPMTACAQNGIIMSKAAMILNQARAACQNEKSLGAQHFRDCVAAKVSDGIAGNPIVPNTSP